MVFLDEIKVSIVSIQADQSRQEWEKLLEEDAKWFQSYQFRQINPDRCSRPSPGCGGIVSIVSIQADQSRLLGTIQKHVNNEDTVSIVSIQADQSRLQNELDGTNDELPCFNRINSGRSIPTSKPMRDILLQSTRFNRINSGRSIPTR